MNSAWRQTDGADRPPRFGARGRRWLRLALLAQYPATFVYRDDAQRARTVAVLPYVVDWLLERPLDVVEWVPAVDYRGPGFADGAWAIRWTRLLDAGDLKAPAWAAGRAAYARAIADAARTADAHVANLDVWLEADRRGTLAFAGAPEPAGHALLGQREWTGLHLAAVVRRRNWPRPCATCGESFRPEGVRKKRCAACVNRAKQRAAGGPTGGGA